ncbi:hypothetical protein PIB30_070632 [Stylosanthes scabra]|uniref:BURP domain-containing protein n=1 Tax=Stylosanthes scabra TaxID=79078 RepID=A0ABU6VNT0_9FABA|nr:hypothetical protein [Stylosanthes scabra]
MLKEGYILQLPNIKDNVPTTVLLPRSIVSKLPFSSSGLSGIFKTTSNKYIMGMMIKEYVEECMRANSASEIKRCVGSMEDMIDFATSILGRDITVMSTKNVNGSKKNLMGWQWGRSGRVFKYPYQIPNL